MPDFSKLPAHIRHTPEVTWMAIDHLRKDVDNLKTAKSDHPHPSVFTQQVTTPPGTYPAYILLAILGLIAMKPDLVSAFLSR